MNILVTNDDSHRSPLLELVVRYFSKVGDVSVIVPSHEQSWTGKCVTRFDPLHVHQVEMFGRTALTVSGRPADCVNLGVYNLLDRKPDLIVSGINAGINAGLGFVLSSGTIGACLEGNLAGIPAIAISQLFDASTHNQYVIDYSISPQQVSIFERQTIAVLDRVLEALFAHDTREEVLSHPITWNINLPSTLTDPRVVVSSVLCGSRYGRCFEEDADGAPGGFRSFHHKLVDVVRDERAMSDISLLRSGVATMCPIDVWTLSGQPPADVVRRVTQALSGQFEEV